MCDGHKIMVVIKPLLKYQLFSFNEPSEGHSCDSDVKTLSGSPGHLIPKQWQGRGLRRKRKKSRKRCFQEEEAVCRMCFNFSLRNEFPAYIGIENFNTYKFITSLVLRIW